MSKQAKTPRSLTGHRDDLDECIRDLAVVEQAIYGISQLVEDHSLEQDDVAPVYAQMQDLRRRLRDARDGLDEAIEHEKAGAR
jgi:hypothetical protein